MNAPPATSSEWAVDHPRQLDPCNHAGSSGSRVAHSVCPLSREWAVAPGTAQTSHCPQKATLAWGLRVRRAAKASDLCRCSTKTAAPWMRPGTAVSDSPAPYYSSPLLVTLARTPQRWRYSSSVRRTEIVHHGGTGQFGSMLWLWWKTFSGS
jgi:hypothetical protein